MKSGAPEVGAPATEPLLAPGVRINEVVLLPSGGLPGVPADPWIELINMRAIGVALAGLQLEVDGVRFQLPDRTLKPNELLVLTRLQRVDGGRESFLAGEPRRIELYDVDRRVLDSVWLPLVSADQTIAREPDGTGDFAVLDPPDQSPGSANPDGGFVRRLASAAPFSPRDSSPNAMLVYDDRFWILGGWRHVTGDVWQSSTDVWASDDAVHWELLNPAPPFIHYCSYVVWRGRMWAIGPTSYSSTDGREWRTESISSAPLNRSAVYHDRIVSIAGATVRQTDDGGTWTTLTQSAAFGEREQPGFLAHADRLWVIGGVTGYGTPGMQLHNDVWSSVDGVQWELVTADAPWTPRHWSSAVAYDGRLFLVNGWDPAAWPEGNGNTNEIWYSDDGRSWGRLPSERRWSARHASFTSVDRSGALVLAAGYGSAGPAAIHNDVWRVDARLFFPKPSGRLDSPSTWGRNMDGSGAAPASFAAANQVFVLRNRPSFVAPPSWQIDGAGSVLVVGDAVQPTTLDMSTATTPIGRVYVADDATLITRRGYADVRVVEPRGQLILTGAATGP